MQSEIFKICESLLAFTDKMDYLEGQSRRLGHRLNRGDTRRNMGRFGGKGQESLHGETTTAGDD